MKSFDVDPNPNTFYTTVEFWSIYALCHTDVIAYVSGVVHPHLFIEHVDAFWEVDEKDIGRIVTFVFIIPQVSSSIRVETAYMSFENFRSTNSVLT